MKYEEYTEMVTALVEDGTQLTPESQRVQKAIKLSLATFSNFVKKIKVVSVTATDSRVYDLPEDWQEGFSEGSLAIQYPVDDNAEQITFLNRDMFELYETPDGTKLRFRTTTNTDQKPASGQAFRVHYAIRYVVAVDGVTLPDVYFDAMCYLCASTLCLMLATIYSQQNNVNGMGDLNTGSGQRGNIFTTLAKTFYERFQDLIDPSKGALSNAMSFGVFVSDPNHREMKTMFPRDASGRDNTDY